MIAVDVDRVLEESAPVRINALGRAVTPHGSWPQSRFFVTDAVVLVYAAAGSRAEVVGAAEIVGFTPHERDRTGTDPFVVETVNGERWELTPTGDCGCGSPLRNLNPFHVSRRAIA